MLHAWLFLYLYNFYFVCIHIVILNMDSENFFLLLPRQLRNSGSASLEQLHNFNPDQNMLGHLVWKVGVTKHFATLTRILLLIRSWSILLQYPLPQAMLILSEKARECMKSTLHQGERVGKMGHFDGYWVSVPSFKFVFVWFLTLESFTYLNHLNWFELHLVTPLNCPPPPPLRRRSLGLSCNPLQQTSAETNGKETLTNNSTLPDLGSDVGPWEI